MNKRIREFITKKKLALEIAKLVEGCIERIRVSVAISSINSFLTRSSLGRNGSPRYSVREHSADEAIPRLKGIVAT